VAEVLDVSNDSAYRRLRGETAVSLDEAVLLVKHFGLSLEELANTHSDAVLFGRSTFRDQPTDFEEYLAKTEQYLQRIVETKVKHGIYAAKDIPIFHFFQIPEIAEFKLFFWLKTIRGGTTEGTRFDFNVIPADIVKRAKGVAKRYFQIPFSEIWNDDTFNTLVRQIDYFNEAGWMANKAVATKLCDCMSDMMKLIQQQASEGRRWFDGKPVHPDVPYEIYYNDLVVLDNAIYIGTDQFEMSMIGYNAMDYLYTFHQGFCKESQYFLQRQIGKSMLLSGAAEKERNKFFNRISGKIAALKEKISAS